LSASGVTLLTGVDQTTLLPPAGTPGAGGTGGTGTPGEGTDPTAPVDPDAYTETGVNAEEVTSIRTEAEVYALSDQYRDEFMGLNYNLTETKPPALADPTVDPVEAAKHYVFNSVIREAEVEQYLNANSWNHVTYKTNDTPTGKQAVLAKGDVTVGSSNVFLTDGSSVADTSRTHLIVSLGDVTVDTNFTGLIIAKGKITVNGACSIKRGGTDLANVLEAKSEHYVDDGSGDNRKPIDMFVNGGGSMLNGAASADVDDAGNLALDYSELVRYMNWIKK
ncbi:MAG: hypothetical protein K2M20_13220, partial [Lachnospiraceae bacterium]|nr:hypothetical protein [Lachnospiraceae bacterium]